MKHFWPGQTLAALAVLVAQVQSALAQAPTTLGVLPSIPGHANERAEDLRVKVIGGFVTVRRTREKDRWKFNPELSALKISNQCSTSANSERCVLHVARGRNEYEHVSGSNPPRYTRKGRTITQDGTGWKWQGIDGKWINYDAEGLALSFGNRNGLVATLQRDQEGRLSGFIDRVGHQVLTYERDDQGRIVRVHDYTGRDVRYAYADDHLVTLIDVRGNMWTDTYSSNKLTSRTDPEGRVTSYSYDEHGAVIAIKDEDGLGIDYRYDYDTGGTQYYLRRTFSGNRIIESWVRGDDGVIRQDLNGRTILKIRRDGGDRIVTDENGNDTRVQLDSLQRVTRLTYPDGSALRRELAAPFNLPRSVTNENGITTFFEYDSRGNGVRITEAVGRPETRVTELEYDAFGQLIRHREVVDGGATDRVTAVAYDDYGNVNTVTDAEGNVYQLESDVRGDVIRLVDPRGKVWRFVYDEAGNLLQTRDPTGADRSYEYDKVGNFVRVTDEEGATTLLAYNRQDRLIRLTDALGNPWRYEYAASGLLARETDPEGHTLRYSYDREGRLKSFTDGNDNATTYEYFAGRTAENPGRDRIERITFPTFTRERRFDVRGRLIRESDIGGNGTILTTRFQYDPVGNVTALTTADGRTSRTRYDAYGRPVEQVLTDGRVVRVGRDAWDQIIRITDPRQQTTHLQYDKLGQLVSETQAGGALTRLAYDSAGNLVSTIDPRNQRAEYLYDDTGNAIGEQTFPSPSAGTPSRIITYAYNRRGELTAYTDGGQSASYSLDDLGQLTSAAVNFGPFTAGAQYSYYRNGLVRTFAAPDGLTYQYTYDANDQLRTVQIPGQGPLTFSAYRWLVPIRITLPGGGVQEYDYDDVLRPTRLRSLDPGGGLVLEHRYTWDAADLLREKTTEHGTYRFSYDDAYRLTSAEHPVLESELYSYDDAGNRLPADPQAQSLWSYGTNNQILTASEASFEYDAAGNRTRRTSTDGEIRYVYDEQSRLVRVESGTGEIIARYGYDPFGQRLWKEIGGSRTYFFVTDDGLVAEFDSAGSVRRAFGYEPGSERTAAPLFLRDSSAHYYYQADFLGAPQQLTNASGTVVWSAVYSPFGTAQIAVESVVNPLRFPGQYYDAETGLHQNYFREYDPELGSYIEADPVGLQDGINRYAYARSNPINFIDPLGLLSLSVSEGDLLSVGCDVFKCLAYFAFGGLRGSVKALGFSLGLAQVICTRSPPGIPKSPVYVSKQQGLLEGLCETIGGAVGGGITIAVTARFVLRRCGKYWPRPGEYWLGARSYGARARQYVKGLKRGAPWPFGPRPGPNPGGSPIVNPGSHPPGAPVFPANPPPWASGPALRPPWDLGPRPQLPGRNPPVWMGQ